MPSIVRIADPTGSTPRPLSLLAVGVGGVVAGLLLVQLSLAAERPETRTVDGPSDEAALTNADVTAPGAGAASSRGAREPASDEDPRAAEGNGDPAQGADGLLVGTEDTADGVEGGGASDESGAADELGSPEDSEGAGAGESPAEADAAEPNGEDTAEEAGPARELTRGRVAYFGCPSDRCSRDHDLEREVFRALERLTGCMGGAGEGDVRVTVEGGAVTEVRFRERGAEGLAISTLDRCLTPPLRRIAGSELPNGVVVSFRFDVR